MPVILRFTLVLLCLWSGMAVAQQSMEILVPRHRLVEDVLPVLQPMVEPGGSISAMSGKIIVRASPANIAQLRQALDAIDMPVRSLLISVRQGGNKRQEDTRLGADARLGMRNGQVDAQIRAEADARSRNEDGRTVQTVQTVDNGQATIFLGSSVPVPAAQVVSGPNGTVVMRSQQYVNAGTGFTVLPRLVGDQVTLSIAPQSQRIQGRGVITGSGLSTTIRGRLGERPPLGPISQSRQINSNGPLNSDSSSTEESSGYWIRVDALD